MRRPKDSCDTIDLIAAKVDILAGIIENDISSVDLLCTVKHGPRIVPVVLSVVGA